MLYHVTKFYCVAGCLGPLRSLLIKITRAFASRSSVTTSAWPPKAASCSGVEPWCTQNFQSNENLKRKKWQCFSKSTRFDPKVACCSLCSLRFFHALFTHFSGQPLCIELTACRKHSVTRKGELCEKVSSQTGTLGVFIPYSDTSWFNH